MVAIKKDEAKLVEKQYQEGLNYKKQMKLFDKWAEHERFKAGDQWPKPTDKTKALPRPVLNIIKQIINHKVASVMNENIRMLFNANDVIDNGTEEPLEYKAADTFTKLADATWERVKQDALNEEGLEIGATTGIGLWHYFWDSSVIGGNSLKYMGDLRGEVIDPVNFFPGNPQNTKIQEQPYILITYRDLVANVKEKAKQNGAKLEKIEKIKPDSDTEDQAYDMAKKELNEDEKVTVITKYWRKEDGMIYFMKTTCGVVIQDETPTELRLYPIAAMQWERRKQSIFGSSDVEGIIPNQKSLNFLLAMQMLSIQNTGWPKIVVDKNRVRQRITNMPGETIYVNGDQQSINNAVQYLNPASLSSQSFQLLNNFMQLTKDAAGANQSLLGEQQSSQLNASAIMLLQKAAGVPLESIKRRFYQAVEDIGLIWAEFWRTRMNTDRLIATRDEDGNVIQTIVNTEEMQGVDLDLRIDIGPSSNYSETLMMTSLDKLFDMQQITLEQYLEFAPRNVVPFKDRLLKKIREQQEQSMAAQEQMLAQLSPEERQAFLSLPPEEQQLMMDQAMSAQAPQQM